ncbi:MTH938/NDUFAF3 family protein [Burkholderiales bacterium]|nr:MTH938/NDUFAF3 family protein [Burkholderiales bacterium]
MKIASQDNLDIIKITQVSSSHVYVGDIQFNQPFFVGTSHPATSWQTDFKKITIKTIEKLPLDHYELLLLGTGNKYTRLDNECMRFLSNVIPFEVMTTVSACRTFNIVAGEGRKVLLAGLINHDDKIQV